MQRAHENARETFRFFWREVAWERRRIVPALDMAYVKAPFSDGKKAKRAAGVPNVEHMWMSEIEFDGEFVTGVLMNSPNWVKSVKEGDSVRIPLSEISDWMYVMSGVVYGAFTVNLMRSRMGKKERKSHDDAWGLDFGDPTKIRIARKSTKGDKVQTVWFGDPEADTQEHPMSVNMICSFKEQIAQDPSFISDTDDNGWTLLHQEALAGSAAIVRVLLDAGADPNAKTNDGKTALQLAQSLGWENVVELLTRK